MKGKITLIVLLDHGKDMHILDHKMKEYIKQAINDITSHSSGEIICVITQNSANYRFYPIFIAAIITLIIMPLAHVATSISLVDYRQISITYFIAMIIFYILSLSFIYTPLGVALTPKHIKKSCAKRFALEQFFSNNLHDTTHKTGILIFISVAEKHVEIISDKGINKVIEKITWDNMMDNLIKSIKQNKLGEGLLYNIPQLKSILVRHFPVKDKIKELTNTVIEIHEVKYIH